MFSPHQDFYLMYSYEQTILQKVAFWAVLSSLKVMKAHRGCQKSPNELSQGRDIAQADRRTDFASHAIRVQREHTGTRAEEKRQLSSTAQSQVRNAKNSTCVYGRVQRVEAMDQGCKSLEPTALLFGLALWSLRWPQTLYYYALASRVTRLPSCSTVSSWAEVSRDSSALVSLLILMATPHFP